MPGISLKYGFTRDIAAEAIFGVSTTTPTTPSPALKFFKNIFLRNQPQLLRHARRRRPDAPNGKSGSEFLGGFGAEFFIPGIESLGFAIETGGSLDNLSGSLP